MKIIALRGKGNIGKSTTIRMLHDILIQNGYQILNTSFHTHGGDFRTVFSKNGKLLGITSSGDTFDLVHDNLEALINAECIICVCACRKFDRSGHGTNAAIDTFLPTYQKEYIKKTIATTASEEIVANQNDAQTLFNIVDELL